MRFSNYYNHEGRNRKIYSRQNLMNMSLKEMLERELELAYQYNTIGIPLDEELLSSQYAHQYMTENGLPYWQAGEDMQKKLEQKQKTDAQRTQIKSQLESNIQGLTARTNSQQFNSNPIQSLDNSDIINEPSYQNRTDSSLLEGFGQTLAQKVTQKKNQEFPDLGRENSSVKQDNLRNVEDSQKEDMYESFAQNYPEELIRNYLDEEQESSIPNDVKLDETEETSKTSKNTDRYLEPEDIMPELAYKKNGDKMMEQEDKGSLTGAAANSKYQVNWDKRGRIYYADKTGRKVNPNLLEKARYAIEDLINHGLNINNGMNLKEELQNNWDIFINNKTDYSKQITTKEKFLDAAIKSSITRALYPIASDFYANSRDNFSRARKNPNANVLENMSTLDTNAQEQLRKYGVTDTDPGVIYNESSEVAKLISESPEFKKILKENIDEIKNGTVTSADIEFKANILDSLLNHKKFDRYNSIQNGVLNNIKYNKNDKTITCDLKDKNDYERRIPKNFLDISKTYFNNFGYNMQEKDNLQNYFTQINMKTSEDSLYKNSALQLLEKLKHRLLGKMR